MSEPTNNAQHWLASLSQEERAAHCRAAGKKVKNRRSLFRENDNRTKQIGRSGGLASAQSRVK